MQSMALEFIYSSAVIRQAMIFLGIAYLIAIAIIHLVFARGV